MGNFDQLVEAATEHLRGRLLARGWSSTEIAALCKRIESLNFPGLLAVLGTAKKRSGLLGAELLGEAARDVAFEAPPDENLESGAVQRFLKAVLHENASLADVPVRESEGEERKREIFEQGISALARRGGMSFTATSPAPPRQSSRPRTNSRSQSPKTSVGHHARSACCWRSRATCAVRPLSLGLSLRSCAAASSNDHPRCSSTP